MGLRSKNSLLSQKKILRHFDRQDPIMASLIRKIGPFKLKNNRRYFQVLCKAIIAQQISTSAARAITSRFMSLFNGRSATAKHILVLTNDTLREVGLSHQKISYLKDLSKHFSEKLIRPHRLTYLSNEDVIQQLTTVRGIGRWTAEMFLIFSLNRLDVLPKDDVGLRIALKNIYKLKNNPPAKKILQLARSWHPYETVGTWYAWRSLEAEITVY